MDWLVAHAGYQLDDCLIWPFGRDDKGYGLVSVGNRKIRKASRIMCMKAHGNPPTGSHVAAHSCGNGHKGCVNPRHLSWKTPSENSQDAVRHGRYGANKYGRKGKITAEQASEIRALAGLMTNIELGAIYGVHAETIAKIRRGETHRKAA